MTEPSSGQPTEQAPGEGLRNIWRRTAAGLREFVPQRFRRDVPVVPVVRLTGIVGFSTPLRPGLSLAGIARTLDRAFTMRGASAVALAINSPGGSPVQSHLIFRRIRELAEQHKRKVIAFIEDAGASGGYMIACAADEIVADAYSIVGSIGVVGGSFGFDKLIARLGIDRRLYTSGEHKAMLDPFLPEDPDDVERLKKLQHEIHEDFITLVKSRRGMLRERFGDKLVTPLVAAERGFLGRRLLGASRGEMPPAALAQLGLAEDVISALEARAIWARYGL
jgi:serine protease SohB